MIRNYFKIALRQLRYNPLFSFLNILGLTVGLAVSTFIALYVWHEFHYDRHHPFADQTYRLLSVANYGGDDFMMAGLHESFATAIKRQIPEAEEVVRLSEGLGDIVLQSDENHRFKEEKIGIADSPALSVLGLRLLSGNPKTALSEPGRIVLTRAMAEKYFGNQYPIGRPLVYDKHYTLTVSGVLDDLPTNSVIQFNALVSLSSMPTLGATAQNVYKSAGFLTHYLVLRPGAQVAQVEAKLKKVKAGIQFVDMTANYILEAMPALHLDSRMAPKTGRQSLYILLTVALVILALAVINYVSLTTARATKRAREVGVRKAVGGQRGELIGQFFTESFLTTTLAFALSLGILQALFPWANQALDLHMDNRVLQQGPYWILLLTLWLGCSLLAGSYPALLLSRFRPQEVLKGTMSSGRSGATVRRVFTTVQFATSIGLLICSIVLNTQMRFLRTKNLGINRSQVVAMKIDAEMATQFPALRDAVRQWAGPENVAVSNTALFTNNISTWFMKTEKTKKQMMVNVLSVDKTFFKMMGIRWLYTPVGWEQKPVTNELTVFNQTLMKEAGIKGNPQQQAPPFKGSKTAGVVADFHVRSLHGPVSPMQLSVVSDSARALVANGGFLLVRLNAHSDVAKSLEKLKALYDSSKPVVPFDYYFLDDAYDKLYAKEQQLMRLFNGFTGLTLLVASLGLLGLITFSVEARTKEIGIRKVLGASVSGIVTLLSKDFLKLVLLSMLIASPVAWYAMDKWLQDFEYKVDIQWWMFALAGGSALVIAGLTVSFQSIKAALMNPASSLRSE
ncbi:ABC transporter permease [Larkinella humicola]|uniref:FtsX-like permease family protein n=1 Tax=Larkinella humicola TaxID=2607654 RepID=A0A5N1JJ62_9BACT|nr:ABC transporter permease [Larkinella humicola]KAA9354731.1 FtsX-like permease family protein [Larkinella humicola]